MGKFSCYIKSARLRTLPLSLAGIITGVGLAASDYRINALVAFLTALTAVCLQILSNVSNEYGDFIHGTDNEYRQGPKYSQGEMSDKDYRRMVPHKPTARHRAEGKGFIRFRMDSRPIS